MGSIGGEVYDDTSESSIIQFGSLLIDKSLAEASNVPRGELTADGKGGLGVLVEWAFFDLPNSNKPEPDFEKVGIELKTTGVIRLKNKSLRAKESLKLTSLNALDVNTETWETSRVVSKCGRMLVLTYSYEKKKSVIDLKFTSDQIVLNLLDPDSVDSAQFKRDFQKIQSYIREGKTEELSSGDTMYLIAKTSGQGKGKGLRKQPNSKELYKPRAFMIRDSYMTQLLFAGASQDALLSSSDLSLEEATESALRPLIGKTVEELGKSANYLGDTSTNKSYYFGLAIRLLSGGKESIQELNKANIKLKTIRLRKSGRMREDMSFRQFKYLEIVNADWEESTFNEETQQKFLFIVFKELADGSEVFYKAGYWNMPYVDRLEAQLVWEETKKRVEDNNYQFPKASETKVAHVRPKGANRLDKFPTPQGGFEQKNCFWLNRSYLQAVIDGLEVWE